MTRTALVTGGDSGIDALVSTLAPDDAATVTGASYTIDGGWRAR